ncbi:ATPase inhibitor [Elasticomyces elasticus]|uniref:ATPase inhibitor, mitochondrial n=1 Tax=Exophiala sideris TaxID=1016849 RepID=A0A0D1YLL3_9EURO|nr:ATPase inhibitor [Elasticomyces elasticus]KAK5031323.1 ATPase inhibitor [Exophiala sideris]KAK5183839.1 ATPase inhibitor [Eurotiomycetes sp. CCFEE 6388]KAK5039043.1 ATPase inhibitor [Exophiala sideris]KAK5060928.1 ATPase inhibitor [Exophiala sideris]
MLRTQVVKLARATPSVQRSFSVAAVRAAEGDTGSTRSGGIARGDAWTNREQANETKFIREREMESLRKLKEKLQQQRKHLDELETHIKDLESERGGEQ